MNKASIKNSQIYVVPHIEYVRISARKCIASSGYTEGFDTSEGSWSQGAYQGGNEGFGTDVPGTWGE